MLQQYPPYNPQRGYVTVPRPQISYQPYMQTPSFAQQHFTPQTRPQPQFQFNSQPEFANSIPIAKSIQYEVPKQTKDNNSQPNIGDKKYSSKMVALIKESQELKRQIQDREKEIQTSKTNIQRLNQLIEYLEKQQDE